MGINSGVTKIFNFDKKLMLTDPVVNDNKISKSVQSWILINPDFIWDQVYSGKIQLCKSAYNLLRQTMAKNSPAKYQELITKKRQFIARKKALEQIRSLSK